MANNNFSAHRSTILAEQVLIQDKIPFHIIFDRGLSELPEYKVLLLADQECLSDGNLQKIRAFVEGGGGLVATGATGDFDQWRRRRRPNGLAQALGFKGGQAARGSFGKGRFVHLPAIIPSLELPAAGGRFRYQGYRDFNPQYWVLPSNWKDLVEALRWAAVGRFSAEIEAPLTTVAELTRKPAENLIMLHLLNYDSRETVEDIRVDLALPSSHRVKSVTLLSPDDGARRPLEFSVADGRVRFKVMRLSKYGLAVLELAPPR
jgi:hypothetical protein